MFKKVGSVLTILLFDLMAIYLAVFMSHVARIWIGSGRFFDIYDREWDQFLSLGLIYMVLISMQFFGLYLKRYDFWEELKRIIKALFISFTIFLFYLFVQKSSHDYSRILLALIFLNLLWTLPLFRIASKRLLYKLKIWQKNIYFFGDKEQLKRLTKTLEPNWFLGYRIVSDAKDAKVVAIATKGMPTDELEDMINFHKSKKREILLIPYLHKIRFANTELVELIIGRLSLISVQNQLFKYNNILIKRFAEWLVILFTFPFAFLIVAVVGIWIKLDSKGSLFYKQKRLGVDGKKFSCYKFRTMREDSEDDLNNYLNENPSEIAYFEKYHKFHKDPRFTKAGKLLRKLSLDELPQIFNVMRGDMSLIGPRPYMMSEVEKLEELKDIILHVKPGITGLWQVSGRNELTFKERVELDVWYIQNWSLWLDFVIFLKTFQVLLSRKGAS